MKKIGLFFSMILVPSMMMALSKPTVRAINPEKLQIPTSFTTSGQTSIVQWGCPVMEVISAKNQAEAIQILSEACMNEARKEVVKKPGVFDVIKVSVIWPDINVSAQSDGFLLKGTFFLETLVLKTRSAE